MSTVTLTPGSWLTTKCSGTSPPPARTMRSLAGLGLDGFDLAEHRPSVANNSEPTSCDPECTGHHGGRCR